MLEITVLTLNIWGIPYVSSDRAERINAITAELSTGKYDIVSLQEVWSQTDSEQLQAKTASVLPYSHYFFSGVLGAGLLVLSKYPIMSCLFHAWCVNGYFHRIQHADWFGGKGVGLCKILVGEHIIHFYNSHLHAEYDDANDDYKTHRVIQAFDTAQFIEATRGNSILQILAGDLNTKPNDISYKILLYTSKMRDCCANENFATNVSPNNSYTKKKELLKTPNGIRIDHIFARSANNFDIKFIECKLPFPERVPGHKFSYSDHEAVLAKFQLSPIKQTLNAVATKNNDDNDDDNHCTTILSKDGAATSTAELNDAAIIETTSISMSTLTKTKSTSKTTVEKLCNDVPAHMLPISNRISALYESVTLCDQQLQQLKKDRIIYFTTAIILLLTLAVLYEFSVPFGFRTLYSILKFSIFGVILFCAFMGSIWNFMEHNGVLAAKMSMEIMLRSVEKNELGIIY